MKQVIIINRSLALPPGKMAAQAAHASVAAFLMAGQADKAAWLHEGMPKIVLDAENREQIDSLFQLAQEAGLPAYLVKDAGRTVVAAGTVTCLGIGPAPARAINAVAGSLPLTR
ncbi:MAG TPA: aminoacyl-tRNA hydrolase [Methylocystis sp.]|nr:aminoacyl-tRNA hydrolase [Methylocystis sp.]